MGPITKGVKDPDIHSVYREEEDLSRLGCVTRDVVPACQHIQKGWVITQLGIYRHHGQALYKKDSLIVGEILLRWFLKREIPTLGCVKLLVLSFTTTQLAEFCTTSFISYDEHLGYWKMDSEVTVGHDIAKKRVAKII
jgi:hypothetical protein